MAVFHYLLPIVWSAAIISDSCRFGFCHTNFYLTSTLTGSYHSDSEASSYHNSPYVLDILNHLLVILTMRFHNMKTTTVVP